MTCKNTIPITKQNEFSFYTEYIAQFSLMIIQPEGEETGEFDSSIEKNDLQGEIFKN